MKAGDLIRTSYVRKERGAIVTKSGRTIFGLSEFNQLFGGKFSTTGVLEKVNQRVLGTKKKKKNQLLNFPQKPFPVTYDRNEKVFLWNLGKKPCD